MTATPGRGDQERQELSIANILDGFERTTQATVGGRPEVSTKRKQQGEAGQCLCRLASDRKYQAVGSSPSRQTTAS